MRQFNYDKWLQEKIDSLINLQSKIKETYDKELIRDYLIFLQYEEESDKLEDFFVRNNQDEKLLKQIIDILLDESEEYSNDARYSASWVISIFDIELLKKYKKELLQAQSSTLIGLRPFASNEIPDWLIN